jgi:hypothetical protein
MITTGLRQMWRALVSKGETGGHRLSKDAGRDAGVAGSYWPTRPSVRSRRRSAWPSFYPEGRAVRGEPFARHFPPGKPSPAPDPPSCPRPRPVSLDQGRVVVVLARYPGRLDSVTNGCGAAWA